MEIASEKDVAVEEEDRYLACILSVMASMIAANISFNTISRRQIQMRERY